VGGLSMARLVMFVWVCSPYAALPAIALFIDGRWLKQGSHQP